MTDLERQLIYALRMSETKRAAIAAKARVHRVMLSRHEHMRHKGMDVATAVRIARAIDMDIVLVPRRSPQT